MIPSFLQNVESVFVDDSVSDGYSFSYRNRAGEVFHVFRDRLKLLRRDGIEEVPFVEIERVELPKFEDAKEAMNAIKIIKGDSVITITVDTKSGGHFLDVFPIHKAVDRLVKSYKQDRIASKDPKH